MSLKLIITAGQTAEISMAERLFNNEHCEFLIADLGYDSDKKYKSGNSRKKKLFTINIFIEKETV